MVGHARTNSAKSITMLIQIFAEQSFRDKGRVQGRAATSPTVLFLFPKVFFPVF